MLLILAAAKDWHASADDSDDFAALAIVRTVKFAWRWSSPKRLKHTVGRAPWEHCMWCTVLFLAALGISWFHQTEDHQNT